LQVALDGVLISNFLIIYMLVYKNGAVSFKRGERLLVLKKILKMIVSLGK
jgi:hypothetical protein